jgi:hypothetical protein
MLFSKLVKNLGGFSIRLGNLAGTPIATFSVENK